MSDGCPFCSYAMEVDGSLGREMTTLLELFNAARVEMGEPIMSASEVSTSLAMATGYLFGQFVEAMVRSAVRRGLTQSEAEAVRAKVVTFCQIHQLAVDRMSKAMPRI